MAERVRNFAKVAAVLLPLALECSAQDNLASVVRQHKPYTTTVALKFSKKDRKAYLYLFSHVRPGPNSKYNGAFHASEIVYVFSNLRPDNNAFQDVDIKLSKMMTSYWVNFATTGDPNGTGLPKWTPYDQKTEPYLEFGDTIQLRKLKEQLDFLEEFQRSSSAAN